MFNDDKHWERAARERRPESEFTTETFEQTDPKGWSIGGGARLVPEGTGRVLRVIGSDRAIWHEHHIAEGRLHFRYRLKI